MSNRKLPQELEEKVMNIYRDKYWGFWPTLANEKLYELDKIAYGTCQENCVYEEKFALNICLSS